MLNQTIVRTIQKNLSWLPMALYNPSTSKLHLNLKILASISTSYDTIENYAIKLAMNCDFISFHGTYLMSKAPNSIAHNAKHPTRLGLWGIVRRG